MADPRSSRSSRDTPAARAEQESRRLWRLTAMGGTMTSEILAGVGLGWLADRWLGTAPTILVIGAIAGVILGMTTFIRGALRESGRAGRMAKTIAHEHDVQPLDDPGEPTDDDWADTADSGEPRS